MAKNKYYTKDQITRIESTNIFLYTILLNSEFIPDDSEPGRLRKPSKDEIKCWKDRIRYSKSIIKYIEQAIVIEG